MADLLDDEPRIMGALLTRPAWQLIMAVPRHENVDACRRSILSPAWQLSDEESSVKREDLQAVQAPLKRRYREDPDAGVVTLRAEAELDSAAVSCSVQTGRALVEAGLHPASGGEGSLACSGDMLLQALVACAGVTLRSVAVNRDIAVAGGRITAEGDLDFRGTMAVDREAPVGFRAIRLHVELDTQLSADDRDTLLALTERYCVVYQTITRGVPVTISDSSIPI
jgi:uncharacterized OsmC-like protein